MASRRRHLTAWVAAVTLHAVFAVLVFGTMSGGGIRGATDPFGEGEAIEVTLSGREGAETDAADTSASTRSAAIADIVARLQAESDVIASAERAEKRSQGDIESLFAAAAEGGGKGRQGSGADAKGDNAASGSSTTTAQSTARGDRGAYRSAGDFFGQVDVCWRALPLRSRNVVTLDVVINDRGRLAGKPTIIRPPGARLDEAQLTAEATALTAIQSCLPAKTPPLPGLQKSYRLTFDPARRRP